MSRAFVKESDEEDASAELPERPLCAEPNYVTPRGLQSLRAQLKELQVERDRLAAAGEPMAKQRLLEVKRDIRYFSAQIERATLVDMVGQPRDEVRFGAVVTMRDGQGKNHMFQIVGDDEADVAAGSISWASPLARALLGARVGDTVKWQRPAGTSEVEIVAIAYLEKNGGAHAMTFLALVGALLLEQWRPLRTGNRLYVAFARYVNRIAQNFNAGQYRDGVISWLLAVVPVALITLIVYSVSHYVNGLLALAWNTVVLYLALGFRQFSHFYNDVTVALRAGDVTRAREVLSRWRGESTQELPAGEIARVAIELGLMRSHRHVFGVMAWFIVLGPVGAIGYRLAALLSDRWGGAQNDEAGAFGLFAKRAFEIIDWLPVRLTAFGFAMTGDFMGAVECWRAQAATWRLRSQGIILAAAAGALGVKLGGVLHEDGGIVYRPQLGEGDEADVDYMQAAVGLIWRALVLWLFLILLATIASWF